MYNMLPSSVGSGPKQQTDPPSIPVTELFPDKNFPEGEIQEYIIPRDGKDEWVQLVSQKNIINVAALLLLFGMVPNTQKQCAIRVLDNFS